MTSADDLVSQSGSATHITAVMCVFKCTNNKPSHANTITRIRNCVLTCVDERTSKGQQEQGQGRQQQQGRGRGGASRRGTWPHPAPCCKGANTHTGLDTNLGHMQPYCDAELSKKNHDEDDDDDDDDLPLGGQFRGHHLLDNSGHLLGVISLATQTPEVRLEPTEGGGKTDFLNPLH